MKALRARFIRNLLILAVAIPLMMIIAEVLRIQLRHDSFFTGWLLLTCLVVLALFNARKKIPYLNLMRANMWLQFHIYLGFFSIAVFLMHLRFHVPNGNLEQLLAVLYLVVAASGIIGIWLSRRMPPRLSRRGEQVLFERIPALTIRLQDEVEQLVLQGAAESDSSTFADLYKDLLFPFFSGTRNFWHHIFESNRPYHQLREKMHVTHRYMNAQEMEIMDKIYERIRTKDELDYQYAGQALLKRWLFIHIPLTYSLLIFALLHLIVIYTFIGAV